MKKIWGWIVGVVIVVAIGIYIILNNSNTAAPVATNANSDDSNTTTTAGMDMANATGSMAGMNMTSTASGSATGTTVGTGYKDGTYTGTVADAVYGKLEVMVTIKNGMIVDTECPIQPNAPGHTSQISASALPQLKQEAIASQSANVSVVSGATQTSEAYQQSLATALAQAQQS